MTLKIAYNSTAAPLLADSSGRTIGGRLWGPVDTLDPIGSAELAAGRLVVADEDALAASGNADAAAACELLAELREAQKMSKGDLIDALPEAVVDALPTGGDNLPPKDKLVDAFVASEPVPASVPETTATKRRTAADKK